MSDQGRGGQATRPDRSRIGSSFKEQKLGESSDWALVRRLWRYMRPYKLYFGVSLLLLPIAALLGLAQPYLLKIAIDDHLVPGRPDGIGLIAALFGLAVFARAALDYGQFVLMQTAGQRALRDLRVETFSHVQGLSLRFFHKNPVGRLMTRMTTDVESLQEALSSGMVTMVGDLFTLAAIVVVLLWIEWRIALISFLVVPPLLLATYIFRRLLRAAFRAIRVEIARLNAHLQESVTGMRVIQLFARERVSAAEYAAINESYRRANIGSVRYDALLYAIVETAGSITVGAIVWYGGGLAVQDLVELGVLVAFIEYMQRFFVPIRELAQKYNLLQSAMASSERIFALLDDRDRIEPGPIAEPPREPLRIEFEDVWFAYKDEEWIVRGLSFAIDACERIALVGRTGAGKSTILKLLLRFHDPQRGRILVNGVDIRDYGLEAWRSVFAVVLQDSFLFRGTIAENIALGQAEGAPSSWRAAASAVGADAIVLRHEAGYEREVIERGQNLSAGERQLVAFARALAHEPQILLLDEATANVDPETERILQGALETLLERQTSIVIAHRLSTIRSASRIFVLADGAILERGTHDELIERGGAYAALYASHERVERDEPGRGLHRSAALRI